MAAGALHAACCGLSFEARRSRGEHPRMTDNLLRGFTKKNFAIPYPASLNRPYHRCRPVRRGIAFRKSDS
jgi:hypothetical protein